MSGVNMGAFLKKFADPNAGKSNWQMAVEGFASVLGGFAQVYALSAQAKAEVADRQQKFDLELRKFAQKDREIDIDAANVESLRASREAQANREALDTASQVERRRALTDLGYGGLDLSRSVEDRRGRQGDEELRLRAGEETGRNTRSLQNQQLRRDLHQTPTGNAMLSQGAITDRSRLRAGQAYAQMLVKGGIIPAPYNEDGTINPEAARVYDKAIQMGSSAGTEDFQPYIEGEQQDLYDQYNSQVDIPGLREQSIGLLAGDKGVRDRLNLLEQETGGRVPFGQIYGATPEEVLGGKGDVPTLFMNPEAGPDSQLFEKALPEADLEFLRQTMEFLNRQTKAGLKDRGRQQDAEAEARARAAEDQKSGRGRPRY